MAPSKIMFAVGLALVAAGNILADSCGEAENTDQLKLPIEGEPEPKRLGRPPGRPPGRTNKPAAETASQVDDEARLTANRALIKPLVDEAKGEEVKKVIAKYTKGQLKDIPAANQVEFEKDIAALSY